MADEVIQTKICIIGAGPAGASTSLFLSKLKINHLIVDAACFPRDKICGDALDLSVLRVLNQLDPNLVEQEVLQNNEFSKAFGFEILFSNNKQYSIEFNNQQKKEYPFFVVTKRAYFDNFLAQKIRTPYADFREGVKIIRIEKSNKKWNLIASNGSEELMIESDFVVGADGDHSTLLRFLGARKIEKHNYTGALRQYWKGIKNINVDGNLEFYFPKSFPMSYFWIFPLPNNEANVGFGIISDLIAKNSYNIKEIFNQIIQEDPVMAPRFKDAVLLEKTKGWGLSFSTWPYKKASGNGYLLTGDAASLAYPNSGEGVGPAMISGYIAAQFIERAVKQNRFDADMFTNYSREINRRQKSDVRKFKFIRRISSRLPMKVLYLLVASGLGRFIYNYFFSSWVNTTKNKPIDIRMD